jgi:hypothetical protein
MARNSKYEETIARGAEEVARLVGEHRGKVRQASREETLDELRHMSDDQITCRFAKHRFTEPLVSRHYTKARFIWVELGCQGGCGVRKFMRLSDNTRPRPGFMEWSSLNYTEAEQYLSEKGKLDTNTVRLEAVTRLTKPRKSAAAPPPRTTHGITEDD